MPCAVRSAISDTAILADTFRYLRDASGSEWPRKVWVLNWARFFRSWARNYRIISQNIYCHLCNERLFDVFRSRFELTLKDSCLFSSSSFTFIVTVSVWNRKVQQSCTVERTLGRIHGDYGDSQQAFDYDRTSFELACQPANPPDFNINYNDFFRAMQSLQDEAIPSYISDLLDSVKKAYSDYNRKWISDSFLSL